MTNSQTLCRRCGAEIPENRVAHCRRLGVEPSGCSTKCSTTLAKRGHYRRERESRGISLETDRAIVAQISTMIESAASDVRDTYYETSRSFKQNGAQRGRITALRV